MPRLDLPGDRPLPAVQNYEAGSYAFDINPEAFARLKSFADAHEASLFSVMLAAFQVLLNKLSGQNDLCIGVPFANRGARGSSEIMGFLVNTLPLRQTLDPKSSFAQIVRQTRENLAYALRHQDLPFQRLVQALKLIPDQSGHPVFQCLFVFQGKNPAPAELADMKIMPVDAPSASAKLDLAMSLEERGDSMHGLIEFRADLFDLESVRRWANHFIDLIATLPDLSQRPLSQVPLARQPDPLDMVGNCQSSQSSFQTAHHSFEVAALRYSELAALSMAGSTWTYAELNSRANQLAQALRAKGVGPGKLVAICFDRSMEWALAILGVLKAGGAFVPLDPSQPKERLRALLTDSESPWLLTMERIQRLTELKAARTLCLDLDWTAISHFGADNPVNFNRSADLAYVIYTSGSTGTPKGVMVEHGSLVNHLGALSRSFGLRPGDRLLQAISPAFDAALEELFPAICSGACLVFGPNPAQTSALEFLKECERQDIQVLHLPTAYWTELVAALPEPGFALLPGLRTLLVGGDSPSPSQTLEWMRRIPQARFLHAYGPTEATITSTLFEPTQSWLESHPHAARLPIGKAIQGVTAFVTDDHMQVQPFGVPGELCIAGQGLARGYWRQTEADKNGFVVAFGRRIYRSGDRVICRSDGNLEFLGRDDDQVKIRGHRIELGEVEAALGRCPGVKTAVVAAKGSSQAKRLVAYVVPADGAALSELILRSHMAGILAHAMLPTAYVVLDALPLGSTGKIDRKALPEPMHVHTEVLAAGPSDPMEADLIRIFSDLLGLPSIGATEGFFSLGGHSLLAMRLTAEISRKFGVAVPLAKIFENLSVSELSAHLRREISKGGGEDALDCRKLPYARLRTPEPSLGQEAFWFFDQLRPQSPVYNMAAAWKLAGDFDLESFRLALSDILRRHEPLRTVFVERNGRLESEIKPAAPLALMISDFDIYPSSNKMERMFHVLQDQISEPFNLSEGPLLRSSLFRLGPREHVFLIVIHHICADGRSLEVIMDDLKACYEGRRAGRGLPAQVQAPAYADFSAWQREWIETDEAASQMAYWQGVFAKLPPALDLPLDHVRPESQSFDGASIPFAIEGDLLAQVRRFCSEAGLTAHELLLTANLCWLRRLTGQESLACGIPVANRRHGNTQGVVGLFMNTLAIRFEANDWMNFMESAAQVRRECLGAYANADLPFERVVAGLNVPRDPGRQPLVQTMLAFQDLSRCNSQWDGLILERLPLESSAARFDLTWHLLDTGGRIDGCLEYSMDILSRDSAVRFARQFRAFLGAVLENPARSIGQIALMDAQESALVLGQWNSTASAFPESARIHELFEAQAISDPLAVAAWQNDATISYGDLNAKANQLANRLIRLGVEREALVCVLVEKSFDFLISILGILKAGAAYVPVDPSYPTDRIRTMMVDADTRLVLTQEKLLHHIPGPGFVSLCLDKDWPAISTEPTRNPDVAGSAHDLAYVIYTSGSTGKPKGVMIEHRGICRLVRNDRYFQVAPGDVMAQQASQSFDMSTDESWNALANGGSLVLMAKEQVLNPEWLRAEIARRKINTMVLATPIFNHLASQDSGIFSSLKTLVLGGEALDPNWVRTILRLGPPQTLINAYGPTECTVWATCERILKVPEKALSIPIGAPISNDVAYVLDNQGRPVPVGTPGELCLGGSGLARGYLRRPKLSSEKFIVNPIDPARSPRLYRTGDLARWLPDGRLDFLGRMDTQVKVSGHRIELGEIEATLGSQDSVKSSAVLAVKVADGDVRLVAYVVPKSGQRIDHQLLRDSARQILPGYMVPTHWFTLESLPLNANGKVDRKLLAAMPLDSQATDKLEACRPPLDALEATLLQIWRDVLRRQDAGMNDDFFSLGGHSLLAVRMTARIRNELGLELGLGELLQCPNVTSIADLLRSRRRGWADIDPIVELQGAGSKNPLYLLHPIGGSVFCYSPLARALGTDRPILAFQSSTQEPCAGQARDLRAMAESYVKALTDRQPKGPYNLAGWSFGGVLAFEMARLLHERGQRVAFLGLIDAILQSRRSTGELGREATDLKASFMRDLAKVGDATLSEDSNEFRDLFKLYEANARALMEYEPGAFSGKVNLFMADEDDRLRKDSISIWEERCQGRTELRWLTGDHYSVMDDAHSARLAELIRHSMDWSDIMGEGEKEEAGAWNR